MEHLDTDTLNQSVFHGTKLGAEQASHLTECRECQDALARLRLMASSLALYVRSEPGPEQMAAYRALYRNVRRESLAERIAQWVKATLLVDTRTAALSGVRGIPGESYRLLYRTDTADIELMIERNNGSRRMEGEVIVTRSGEPGLPALISLESGGRIVAEVESNDSGRFRFDGVPPGDYRLWVAFANTGDIVIEGLEIG